MASYLNKYPHLQANIKQVQALINQRVVVANPKSPKLSKPSTQLAVNSSVLPSFFYLQNLDLGLKITLKKKNS